MSRPYRTQRTAIQKRWIDLLERRNSFSAHRIARLMQLGCPKSIIRKFLIRVILNCRDPQQILYLMRCFPFMRNIALRKLNSLLQRVEKQARDSAPLLLRVQPMARTAVVQGSVLCATDKVFSLGFASLRTSLLPNYHPTNNPTFSRTFKLSFRLQPWRSKQLLAQQPFSSLLITFGSLLNHFSFLRRLYQKSVDRVCSRNML